LDNPTKGITHDLADDGGILTVSLRIGLNDNAKKKNSAYVCRMNQGTKGLKGLVALVPVFLGLLFRQCRDDLVAVIGIVDLAVYSEAGQAVVRLDLQPSEHRSCGSSWRCDRQRQLRAWRGGIGDSFAFFIHVI